MSIPAGSYVSPAGSASSRIPVICGARVSDKAKQYLDIVEKFVEEECIPADQIFAAQLNQGPSRWISHPRIVEELKVKAQVLGLWNLFLPQAHFPDISPGFSNLEYGLMAECLGKSVIASEATNCAAPDTGNMEVLARYGTPAQQQEWLRPLLAGHIRSAFLMTEPDVASSDATNIALTMRRDGDHYILNGAKWWASGAGSPDCQLFLVMGQTDATNPSAYSRQSVILVPTATPGLRVHRMLSVMGFDDAPHGHGHVTFTDVRVPARNLLLGPGRGFEIIQGRLGPGRIHHAMRAIGLAEKALEWMVMRVNDPARRPFDRPLAAHGTILAQIAQSRIDIDASRLVVLNAAIRIDEAGAKAALLEIAEAKILVPNMALEVLDRAMQAFGAAGLSQDTPLAAMWAHARTLRIVDGPDEVHLMQMGRNENRRGDAVAGKIKMQKARAQEMYRELGLPTEGRFLGDGMLKSML